MLVVARLAANSVRTRSCNTVLRDQGGLCLSTMLQDGQRGSSVEILENPLMFDLTTDRGYAVAANSVMRLRPGGVLVVAICCESFSIMCPGFYVGCSCFLSPV